MAQQPAVTQDSVTNTPATSNQPLAPKPSNYSTRTRTQPQFDKFPDGFSGEVAAQFQNSDVDVSQDLRERADDEDKESNHEEYERGESNDKLNGRDTNDEEAESNDEDSDHEKSGHK